MMKNINTRIIQSFYLAIPELEDEHPLTYDTSLRNLAIDSLDLISVMFEMENEFQIDLRIEDLAPLDSLKEIEGYILSRIGGLDGANGEC